MKTGTPKPGDLRLSTSPPPNPDTNWKGVAAVLADALREMEPLSPYARGALAGYDIIITAEETE